MFILSIKQRRKCRSLCRCACDNNNRSKSFWKIPAQSTILIIIALCGVAGIVLLVGTLLFYRRLTQKQTVLSDSRAALTDTMDSGMKNREPQNIKNNRATRIIPVETSNESRNSQISGGTVGLEHYGTIRANNPLAYKYISQISENSRTNFSCLTESENVNSVRQAEISGKVTEQSIIHNDHTAHTIFGDSDIQNNETRDSWNSNSKNVNLPLKPQNIVNSLLNLLPKSNDSFN